MSRPDGHCAPTAGPSGRKPPVHGAARVQSASTSARVRAENVSMNRFSKRFGPLAPYRPQPVSEVLGRTDAFAALRAGVRTDRVAAARSCRASCPTIWRTMSKLRLREGWHPDPLCCAQRVGRSSATGRTAVARRSAKTRLAGLDATRTRAPEGCAGAAHVKQARMTSAGAAALRGLRSSRTVTAAGRARADGGPA